MKKTLIIILVLSSLNTFSQSYNYIPFPEIHGEWTYMLYDDYGNPEYYFSFYRLLGDTVIGDSTYKKVFSLGTWDPNIALYIGAMREYEKIIYFIPDTSSTELILYDFNLSIGDTLYNPIDANGEYMVLEVIWNDGVYAFNNGAYWYEGVGNENGLLNPFYGFSVSGGYRIHCMMNDGAILVNGLNCFLDINETEIPTNEISIFPNPSNSNFTIKLENGTIKELWVLDSAGRRLFYKKDINQDQISIDKLSTGIYLLKIIDDRGRTSIEKLISSP